MQLRTYTLCSCVMSDLFVLLQYLNCWLEEREKKRVLVLMSDLFVLLQYLNCWS